MKSGSLQVLRAFETIEPVSGMPMVRAAVVKRIRQTSTLSQQQTNPEKEDRSVNKIVLDTRDVFDYETAATLCERIRRDGGSATFKRGFAEGLKTYEVVLLERGRSIKSFYDVS